MGFKERSLLFAQLAIIAYYSEKKARSQAKRLGLQQQSFITKKGHKHIVS